jgi:hypothetical protein
MGKSSSILFEWNTTLPTPVRQSLAVGQPRLAWYRRMASPLAGKNNRMALCNKGTALQAAEKLPRERSFVSGREFTRAADAAR